MRENRRMKRIAILGGGPSGLFMLKRLLESQARDFEIDIFEKTGTFGAGMPYSSMGANEEHVTNVSDNEIPDMVSPIHEWIDHAPQALLDRFGITTANFNEYKVLPRLFFGAYLTGQFHLLLERAKTAGVTVRLHAQHDILDVMDHPDIDEVWVKTDKSGILKFNACIMCTGHHWPMKNEASVPGYYDSPYPPSKLKLKIAHPVALKGASLTAIDAIRTLSRQNGSFRETHDGMLSYHLNEESRGFKIVMHSLGGLLPAIRFHLEDTHLSGDGLLTPELIKENMAQNSGFLSLDFVFQKAFKETFREKDPEFFLKIRDMGMEEFVESMMELRERLDPFVLFRAEFKEAEQSIRRHESVYWKEMLAVLSFTMNYPAKHFSAEDMQRLKKILSPLIALVIAFVPQGSAMELLALHDAGILDVVAVDKESHVDIAENGGIIYHYTDEDGQAQSVPYQTFIDCVGQPALRIHDFPFQTLVKEKTVSQAMLKFKDADAGEKEMRDGHKDVEKRGNEYYLKVPGIAINDHFQVTDAYDAYNKRIYMMAVPYISGFNPDYSGLDFCQAASGLIVEAVMAG
jgi:uncharacterized NAD(P)/FAD-binding protein YdhS